MAYVTVDVDISDFDKDDVLDYAANIIKKYKRQPKQHELIKMLKELEILSETESFKVQTLDDLLKFNHLKEVYKKYTLTEIENKLPV